MKLMHTTTLNTKEFNKVSDNIADALYALNPDVRELYDIHINYIDSAWVIDFIPLVNGIPVIKINTRTDNTPDGTELLRVIPMNLTDLPNKLKFTDDDSSYDLCMNYVVVFEFILNLYDFEYKFSH